jgi:hypothetical protein
MLFGKNMASWRATVVVRIPGEELWRDVSSASGNRTLDVVGSTRAVVTCTDLLVPATQKGIKKEFGVANLKQKLATCFN